MPPSHELFFALLSFGGTKESKNPFTGEWMQCYTLKAIASEEEPLSSPLSSRALLRLPETSPTSLPDLKPLFHNNISRPLSLQRGKSF
ncbi:MAG: hypothetical protein U0V49_11510 [Saprospiraceae bacterium]